MSMLAEPNPRVLARDGWLRGLAVLPVWVACHAVLSAIAPAAIPGAQTQDPDAPHSSDGRVPAPAIAAGPTDATGFRSGRASFSVSFRDVVTPYRTFLLTATPGERVRLHAVPAGAGSGTGRTPARFEATASAGSFARVGPDEWDWTAPDTPGHYRVEITEPASGERIALSAAVLVPITRLDGGLVSGYRIGTFPTPAYRGLAEYEVPPGLLILRREDAGIPVSPHFTLGQFPAKGPAGWPKYLVLNERLLLKLELLLEEANRRGIAIPTFQVLSGFRSPWYNASIGRPRYSRHIYGDAADIYVDTDGDGRMDDLNADGRVNLADASLLYDVVDAMDGAERTRHLIGGLGRYPTTSTHGPFIHVDTRLYGARW